MDFGKPLGVHWLPCFRDLVGPTITAVYCGHDRCGKGVGYRVIEVRGLRLLVGSRRMGPALMANDETREWARKRALDGGRLAGRWLGHVTIPLDGPAGAPVRLTQAIANAVQRPELRQEWAAWLSGTPSPVWADWVPADCGTHTTRLVVSEVHNALAAGHAPTTATG